MAKAVAGLVRVVGRFPAGAVVALVGAAGPQVLRASGKTLARKRVDEDGAVEFSEGVEVGARYFVTGQDGGRPVEVRCVGVDPDDQNAVLSQAPVSYDERKFAGGEPIPVPVSGALLDGEFDPPEEREGEPAGDPPSPVAAEDLTGQALKDRARELEIVGRGSMTADELRSAVADQEKAAA